MWEDEDIVRFMVGLVIVTIAQLAEYEKVDQITGVGRGQWAGGTGQMKTIYHCRAR